MLGSGRLFDNNEGPNVKLSFDGVRWITQTSQLRWDVFALKPVEDNFGFLRRCSQSPTNNLGQLSHASGADTVARNDRSLLPRACDEKRRLTIAGLRQSFVIL